MQVFISYDPADEAFYQALAARLREAGVETSPSTRATTSRANKALQRADALIVLLSASGLSSVRVRSQALWFFTLTEINPTKRLVPVWIGGKPLPLIWPFLSGTELVVRGDSTDDDEDFIARICSRLDVVPPAVTQPRPHYSQDMGPDLPTIQLPPIPPIPPAATRTMPRRNPWPLLALACVVLVSLLAVGFMVTNGGHAPGATALVPRGATSTATAGTLSATSTVAHATTIPTASATHQPKVAATGTPVATPSPLPPVLVLAVNTGSTMPYPPFVADSDVTGGNTYTSGASIDTNNQVNPAPPAVYQSERWGTFTYRLPNLQPGHVYTVRLHFAEIYWTRAGQRVFNVNINGQPALTEFDIFAAAGGANKAIIKEFPVAADNTGQITLDFLTGSANFAKISGIEVYDGGR